jgi:hypothetical protein
MLIFPVPALVSEKHGEKEQRKKKKGKGIRKRGGNR